MGKGVIRQLLAIGAGCGLLWLGLWLFARPPEQHSPVLAGANAREAQHRAYATWIAEQFEILRPASEAAQALSVPLPDIVASDEVSRARFDRAIQRFQATLPALETQLASRSAPDFPALNLPPELTPAAILRGNRQTARDMRIYLETLARLSEAARNGDREAYARMRQAAFPIGQSMRAARVTRERAVLVAVPRSSSDWETVALQVEYFQAALPLQEKLIVTPAPRDAAMAADLLARADRVAGLVRAGRAKREAEIRRDEAHLRRAESEGRTAAAATVRRYLACRRIGFERFDLLADFERFLRRSAAVFRDEVSPAGAAWISREHARIGDGLNEIGRRCSEAMSGRGGPGAGASHGDGRIVGRGDAVR